MYFEYIFNKISLLWKKSYTLYNAENTKTYIEDLANDWEKIDHLVSYEEKGNYNDWEKMMLFIMYQVITEYGIEQYKLGKQIVNINDIPISRFEKKYLENLHYEGNEKYLKKYKGFQNPVQEV